MHFFLTFYSSKNTEKMYQGCHKNINDIIIIIIANVSWASNSFLKDHEDNSTCIV